MIALVFMLYLWLGGGVAIGYLLTRDDEPQTNPGLVAFFIAVLWPIGPVAGAVVFAVLGPPVLWRWLVLQAWMALVNGVACRRAPDVVIGGGDPYLRRWWVIPRNPVFNVYLHQVLRSDDDRALHDHPWFNASLILDGGYGEHTIARGGVERRVMRRAGAVKLRSPWAAHRLELIGGAPCWTLFVTGPRLRKWGFHCPKGWRPWDLFCGVDPLTGRNDGTVGRGCGEG